MYTVLLVDDEKSVLHILTNSIDWQEMGVDTRCAPRTEKAHWSSLPGKK